MNISKDSYILNKKKDKKKYEMQNKVQFKDKIYVGEALIIFALLAKRLCIWQNSHKLSTSLLSIILLLYI